MVLVYVLKGGLTSAIYTEVLQFFMIVLGFAPVVFLGFKDMGGWDAIKGKLVDVAQNPAALYLNNGTFRAGRLDQRVETGAGRPVGQSDGRGCVRHRVRPRLCAFVRLLVHQLPGRPARHGGQGHDRRAPHALDRRHSENGFSRPGHFARHDRRRPGLVARQRITACRPWRSGRAPMQARGRHQSGQRQCKPTPLFDAVSKDIGLKLDKTKIDGARQRQCRNAACRTTQIKARLQDAVAENDYDSIILSLVKRYCPSGLLGLALTALLASFMSGMAGNVTAFNTVWTYDLYQAYLAPNRSDQHYFRMGQVITVVGIVLSIGCAYFASHYSNAMDIVQLVFGFVNAPLFATFLLGMFWARTTGHGRVPGIAGGHADFGAFPRADHRRRQHARASRAVILRVVQTFPSEMAQNFWLASFAFTACFVLTLVISLATKTHQNRRGIQRPGLFADAQD